MTQTSTSSTHAAAPSLPPTRLYYGWVMLPIATLAFISTSPAQTFGISTFNEAFRTSLGLSHSQLTGAFMLGTFLASLPMSYVGAMMDRFGLRKTLTAIILLFGLACVAASQARGLTTIFLAFFLLRMVGKGAMDLLSGNTLAFWFDRRLGTVEGIRQLGMAAAIATVPAFNLWLIDAAGWRWTYVIWGIIIWACLLPLMLIFRNRPEDVGQQLDGQPAPSPGKTQPRPSASVSFTLRQACRTRAFWIVTCATGLWGMTTTAALFNIGPILLDRGLTEADVAHLFTVFAISLAVMQLCGGTLADRLPLNHLLSVAMLALVCLMTSLWLVDSSGMITLCALLMGITQGLVAATNGPLWARYYGRKHLGRIRGSISTMMVAASSAGPFILGLCRDLLGSFDHVLFIFALLPVPLVGAALLATPPSSCEESEADSPNEPSPEVAPCR